MVFADVLCLKRRRRGDWRVKTPNVEVRRERRIPIQTQPVNRGCVKMPLPVTEDTPPDMLAGAMDIKVLLPSGRTVGMSVERSTPMMDLLVQLTTTHKLSLAGHTTVALSDSGYPLHHLPSTPLGALDTRLIHVAQRTNTLKRAPLRPNNVQPFTTTFRLQVHLPRNQLFVTRVSPDTRLSDILHLACSEKNLDPDKYELRHPANLCECLSLSHTLADYRLQEVTLVASRPPGAPLTPADIMSLQREEEKRRQQVKKTGGIYSIIFNKRSKGIPEGSGSVSSDSLNGRSISPTHSDESIGRSVSPPAPAPPTRPGRKRRPAPKPPVPATTPVTVTHSANREIGVDSSKEGSTTLSHSRTSSDSSGYHEASVLSESPDTRTNSSADTLPRRSKLPSTNHIVAKNKSTTLQHSSTNGNHNLSRSLSNLTAVGINAQNKHSASTTSLASQGLTSRKKKAAPPPPVAPVKEIEPQQKQDNNNTKEDVSKPTEPVAALPTEIKTTDEKPTVSSQSVSSIDKSIPDLDKNIHKQVQVIQKLDDILDEEEIALDLTTAKVNSVPKPDSVKQTSIESKQSANEERSLDFVSSKVENKRIPVTSPDLVTSAIVHSPPPAVQDEEVDDVQLQTGIPPCIEAVLRNNDLGGTSSPDLEEVPDWQYHLPAPPSAFRDLHSPTTTEFETVVLADANVFQEVIAEKQSKAQEKYRPHTSDQLPSNGLQEDLMHVDGVSIESRESSSPQTEHSSQSSEISLENYEKCRKSKEDVVTNNIAVNSEQDWEPQTIAIVENVSKPKLKFNNGDLRLRQDGVTKEVYKVNPLFDAQHFEEDIVDKGQITSTKCQSEENDINRSKNTINRGSNTDLQSSNQLKNFTISTYNKPKNMDSIFMEENVSHHLETVFKKPFVPEKVPPVTRTNSYNNTDKDRPLSTVKRSTSYVSLARPYAKPLAFQSVSRTKSISNLVLEEDSASSYLRKTTSEANLSQAEDAPLQSLQVLKSILPRLSQSQVLYKTGDKPKLSYQESSQPQEAGQTLVSERSSGQLQAANQDAQLYQGIDKTSQPVINTLEMASETPQHPPQETNPVEVPKSEPRPFVYRGPPAINFSTWQERPKIQVSLKSDQDYRMGKKLSSTSVNTSQTNVQQASRENVHQTSRETITNNIKNNVVDNSRDIKTIIDKVAMQNKSVVNSTEERSAKIEPTPLTMRIISHTASSNYRCYTSPVEDIGQVSQPVRQELTSSVTDLREERLPIVRAVELKKTVPESFVQLRNMSTTHLNGPNTNNVANVPVNYHQGTFYNRHSYIEPAIVKTIGPISTSANHPTLTKSISTSQINIETPDSSASHTYNNSNVGKKYTSVVGINGSGFGTAKVIHHSSSAQNLQSTALASRSQNSRPNFSTVKVNGFGGAKPMPTVKGFRFAGTDAANYDRGTVKTSVEQEKPENFSVKHSSKSSAMNGMQYDSNPTKQPLKTLNGIDNSKSKSSSSHLTFGPKIQRNPSVIHDRVDGVVGNGVPEPPKPQKVVFKKPIQRPPVSLFTNPRDELMDAIKNFGGQERLKAKKVESNVILTK